MASENIRQLLSVIKIHLLSLSLSLYPELPLLLILLEKCSYFKKINSFIASENIEQLLLVI